MSHLVLAPLGYCSPVWSLFASELSGGCLQPVGRRHMGQGLGASHRGLVTTDHRGPGVARKGEGHGATAARDA